MSFDFWGEDVYSVKIQSGERCNAVVKVERRSWLTKEEVKKESKKHWGKGKEKRGRRRKKRTQCQLIHTAHACNR